MLNEQRKRREREMGTKGRQKLERNSAHGRTYKKEDAICAKAGKGKGKRNKKSDRQGKKHAKTAGNIQTENAETLINSPTSCRREGSPAQG